MKGFRTVKIEGRSVAAGVKHVRTLTVCGVRVPVIRGTVEQIPELRDADGAMLDAYFCLERLAIFVRAGQSPTHERDTIVHEAVHAFLYLSGLTHRLKGFFRKFEAYERFEEEIVRQITPHIVALDLGGKPWL